MQKHKMLGLLIGLLATAFSSAVAQPYLSAGAKGLQVGTRLSGEALFGGKGLSSLLRAQVIPPLSRQQWREVVRQVSVPGPFISSTFVARSIPTTYQFSFSGTVVEVTGPGGEKEIFGVVPAHAISEGNEEIALRRFFMAAVYKEGNLISIPAEIVQLSAPSMLDIALVKFRPEDEKLFTPLKISRKGVTLGERLQSQGYVGGEPIYLTNRTLLNKTPFGLRTTLLLPRVQRAGLCGSAVVNDAYELVGIHTGSSRETVLENDIGYATSAEFLDVLVDAYHNNAETSFPFYLGEQKIFDLRVNEFISHIRLVGESGDNVWKRTVYYKFPYNEMMNALPGARYAEFSISQVQWKNGILVETRANPRLVRYDLQQHQMMNIVLPEK